MNDLRDRVALVTGASRGIGRSVALALAAAGAHVVVNYRSRADEARDVAERIRELGRRAVALGADVSNEADVARLVREARAELGAIDVLVSNAGVANAVTLDALTPGVWDETIAVNLRSAFLVTSAVVPEMRARRWGRLVYVTSTAAQVGGIIGPHYAASKAGLQGMMHAYAAWLAKDGVTANAVAPALIDTDMIRSAPNARADRIPLGRFGAAEEVADAIVAVAANAFITGQTLQVNGGVYMT